MKFSTTIVAIGALLPGALAHYRFPSLIVNGQVVGGQYQYVRQNSNMNSPIENVQSTDFRCNAGALTGPNTQTYTVQAGASVGFAADQQVFHPGPYIVYLGQSGATSDSALSQWNGSGANWFKIHQRTVPFNSQGPQWEMLSRIEFRLPTRIPSGRYLLRLEHIALHSASNYPGAQFYISCAQLNIQNGSGGSPPKVSIPGVYSGQEPGIKLNIYYPVPTTYAFPGPNVYA